MRSQLLLKLADRSDPVDHFGVLVMFIKAGVEIIVEIADDATSNSNRHPEDIDEDVQLVFKEIPDGNEDVVLYHESRGSRKDACFTP